VTSSLLWSLVAEELLREFNDSDYYTVGHEDNIAVLINGKLLSRDFKKQPFQQSSDRTNLSNTSSKSVMITLIRKRDIRRLKEPTL
jgi:hypothetical protein